MQLLETGRAFPHGLTAGVFPVASVNESMHMIMWVMSDRAIPRSFRFMEGLGRDVLQMAVDEQTQG